MTMGWAREVIREDGSFADEGIANSVRSLGSALVAAMKFR